MDIDGVEISLGIPVGGLNLIKILTESVTWGRCVKMAKDLGHFVKAIGTVWSSSIFVLTFSILTSCKMALICPIFKIKKKPVSTGDLF